MNLDDLCRIRHIVDALAAAARFIEGRQRSDLDTDEMLLFALTRAIEIVGEAANNISAETRDELPAIPWNAIIGMRHRLVHVYFDVDRDILWTTVTEAAPPVAEQLKQLLPEE